MDVKDEVSAKSVIRTVSIKNRRVTSKWQQLAKAIDIQRDEKSTEINEHRNRLLKQRDEIQTRTISLTSKRPSSEMTTFQTVCDALMARMRQGKQANLPSEVNTTTSLQRSTRSWEKKKVNRKNMSFSISELKGKNEPKQNKTGELENEMQCTVVSAAEAKPRRPKSAFDLTEEEKEISRKLYSSPTALPRIDLQSHHRPKQRSFSKEAEFRKRISVDEDSWKDIHQCRYLRIHPLRRSSTVPDFKNNSNQ